VAERRGGLFPEFEISGYHFKDHLPLRVLLHRRRTFFIPFVRGAVAERFVFGLPDTPPTKGTFAFATPRPLGPPLARGELKKTAKKIGGRAFSNHPTKIPCFQVGNPFI